MKATTRVVPLGDGPGAPPQLQHRFHVSYCEAKGEDVSIVSKSLATDAALYAVADGHNGAQAAKAVARLLPSELRRELGDAPGHTAENVRTALARAFIATNDAVCHQFQQSGCTLTAAVVSGGVLTLANVGDSKAILDTGAEVVELTEDHRIGASPAELARLQAAGGRLARLNEHGAGPSRGIHSGVGPVRLWPGGIMVGRAVGDRDIGGILIAHPHIRQIKLPPTGARLIIATDGLWDAMPAGRVARLLRSQANPKAAAMQAVSGVAASLGGLLRDDVTVVVVDFLPEGCTDFREVCRQFQGRLRNVLSNPQLSALVLEDGVGGAAVQQQQQQHPAQPGTAAQAPRRGLFACFSKPAVLEAEWSHNGSVLSQRDHSGRSGTPRDANWSAPAGRHAHRSAHLGGSERSMRSGVAREPSVRGCQRATSVELLFDGDSAGWSAAQLGRAPSASLGAVSRSSSGSVHRSSPRSLTDAMYGQLGHSMASMSSEDDAPEHPPTRSPRLLQALSLPLDPVRRVSLSRNNSAPEVVEKKCHGSGAAAALLLQGRQAV